MSNEVVQKESSVILLSSPAPALEAQPSCRLFSNGSPTCLSLSRADDDAQMRRYCPVGQGLPCSFSSLPLAIP